ncbi:hypothetical protein POTOM_001381 [Populus tomentosa]|uniref:Nuclear pore complex protein n=1 Tax=Populus tomentosa TaxID=118781 RepID=A0A8X8IVG4_POPTO|nr:hypothetical protein POTOM_001381 [Populus tomentosa]
MEACSLVVKDQYSTVVPSNPSMAGRSGFWNIIGALGLISELMDICIQQTRLITLLEEIYMLKVANFTLFSTTDHACVLLEFGLNLSVQGSHVGTYLPKSGIWHQTQRFLQKGASNTNTVQHLDFDAPTREHAHQLLDDKKQDESLLEDIWTLLRAGRLEKALDLCRSAGQPWRAATLCPFGGLDLVPSVEALVKNGKNRRLQAIELESGIGHQWHLWKWASYCASESSFVTISVISAHVEMYWHVDQKIAEQNGGKYEVAVYAAQCSNLKRILPICTNWESACWAMSKSWLDARVDLELARSQPGRTVQLKSYGDVGDGSPGQIDGAAHAAGPENWPQQVLNQQPRNLSALLQKLHSGELVNEAVSRGCKEQHRQIEMDLMLGNIPHLLDMIWSWIAPSEDDQNIFRPHGDSQMIRFGAHLVLVLRYLHAEEMQDSFREKLMTVGDLILHMYVMFLFTKQHEELVGIYASQLARHRCIDLFVHMMELRLNSSVHVKYKIFLSAMEYLPFSSEDDSKGSFEEIIERILLRSREVKGGKYDKSSDVAEQHRLQSLEKATSIQWLCFTPPSTITNVKEVSVKLLLRALTHSKSRGALSSIIVYSLLIDVLYHPNLDLTMKVIFGMGRYGNMKHIVRLVPIFLTFSYIYFSSSRGLSFLAIVPFCSNILFREFALISMWRVPAMPIGAHALLSLLAEPLKQLSELPNTLEDYVSENLKEFQDWSEYYSSDATYRNWLKIELENGEVPPLELSMEDKQRATAAAKETLNSSMSLLLRKGNPWLASPDDETFESTMLVFLELHATAMLCLPSGECMHPDATICTALMSALYSSVCEEVVLRRQLMVNVTISPRDNYCIEIVLRCLAVEGDGLGSHQVNDGGVLGTVMAAGFKGELARFQAGVTMEISRLDAWYTSADGTLEGPATYIVRGLCRRCCLPEIILRCMQDSSQFHFIKTHSIAISHFSVLPLMISAPQVSVSLMESGNPPECHDELMELVACPDTGFLQLFSQQQLQEGGGVFVTLASANIVQSLDFQEFLLFEREYEICNMELQEELTS